MSDSTVDSKLSLMNYTDAADTMSWQNSAEIPPSLGIKQAWWCELAFLMESDSNFPWENTHLEQSSIQYEAITLDELNRPIVST